MNARLAIVVAAFAALVALGVAGNARAQMARTGNPIAAVPLASLNATMERPLFSPSRRPPPAPVVAAEPATPAPAAPVAEPPEPPPFTLLGTLLGDSDRIGIFVNEHTRQSTRIHVGGTDSGWTLVSIDPRSAVMKGAGQVVTLALPEKSTNAPISLAARMPGGPAYEPPPSDDPDAEQQPPPQMFRRHGGARK